MRTTHLSTILHTRARVGITAWDDPGFRGRAKLDAHGYVAPVEVRVGCARIELYRALSARLQTRGLGRSGSCDGAARGDKANPVRRPPTGWTTSSDPGGVAAVPAPGVAACLHRRFLEHPDASASGIVDGEASRERSPVRGQEWAIGEAGPVTPQALELNHGAGDSNQHR